MAKAKKLPSGSWNVLVYAGEENGKRKYESFTAETKREAEFAAAEYTLKRKDRQSGNFTVKDAFDRYIDSKCTVLSPTSVREYRNMAKRDLKSLHDIKLRDLTIEAVQKAIDAEAKTHSPKSVTNTHGFLAAVLNMFLPDFKLHTTLPKKLKSQRYIPNDKDIETLLNYVRGRPIEVPILLAATGSLRRSEIAALLPEDITDLGVNVSKAMVFTQDKKWIIKRPKTTAGYRFSPLPPSVIKTVKGGLPTGNPDQIYRQFATALVGCGLTHFRFHDLRHYYASTLHALGVPDKYIMQNGGWETDSVLKNIYQHAMSDRATTENEKVIDFFEGLNNGTNAKRNAKQKAK